MKTFKALRTGLERSVKIWKGILVVWIFYLSFVSLLVLPMRSFLKSGFGNSMITEKLLDGFNIEVFSDLEQVSRSLVSSLSAGLFLAALLGFIMNAFLSGGLFHGLKADADKFRASEFFKASAKYFRTFLLITFIISIVILLFIIFIFYVPVALVALSEPESENVIYLTAIIAGLVFLILTLILLSVADYARAWNAVREHPVCFRAIGFGLSRTFRRFRSSFTLIFIIAFIQVLFAAMILYLVGTWKPVSGWGVFLMFIVSQLMFILRILIKVWRYGSITNLMEMNDTAVLQEPVMTDRYIGVVQNNAII